MGASMSLTVRQPSFFLLLTCISSILMNLLRPRLPAIYWLSLLLIVIYIYAITRPRPIFLVDFSCFRPPITCRAPLSSFIEHANLVFERYSKVADVYIRVLQKSGMGDETSLPPAIHYVPPMPTSCAADEEARMVIFSLLDSLFAKTGISPGEIDILVLNCNVFSPTPSLTSLVVNRYKMRSNIKTYNLSGMGCSAELIAVDLAKELLQVGSTSSYALLVSTEIITPCCYLGKHRPMLVTNCLFRMGGAAVLLSNRPADCSRSKYRLTHVVRTHMGFNDRAYNCVQQEEDDQGFVGFSLSKDLPVIAGEALKANITALAPLVLPISEQLRFVANLIRRKLFRRHEHRPYVPDFRKAFEHFCIHAGGRAVIDDIEKSLRLSPADVEASRMTLYRFGNTSSSSPWYSLSYTEAMGRMKKGDRVWQIALGSGFKCNSAVWKCVRTVGKGVDGSWADCIDKYPVEVPDVLNF